jgi:hypothetical protein
MKILTVHELRDDGGAVLDRGSSRRGVDRDPGWHEVAELRPGRRPAPAAADLIERRHHLPKVDPDLLRRDIDLVLDSTV